MSSRSSSKNSSSSSRSSIKKYNFSNKNNKRILNLLEEDNDEDETEILEIKVIDNTIYLYSIITNELALNLNTAIKELEFHGEFGTFFSSGSRIITIATPTKVIKAPKIIFTVMTSSNPSYIENKEITNAFTIANTGAMRVKGVTLESSYLVIK